MLRAGLIGLFALGLLLLTPGFVDGALSLAHNDRVHYGGHLIAGRVLSLCPCTAQLAETQYVKGMYHARTPRQAALLTTQRPTSMRAHLDEVRELASGAARRISAQGSTGGL